MKKNYFFYQLTPDGFWFAANWVGGKQKKNFNLGQKIGLAHLYAYSVF